MLLKQGSDKKVTCAAIDREEKYLAVSDEDGLITIHNIFSAGTLYKLEKIGSELTQLHFFSSSTNFWIVACGWEGKLAFVKSPMAGKQVHNIPILLKTSGHQGDIYTIDYSTHYVVTGGVDNKVCLWNALTGTLRCRLSLPKPKPNVFVTCVRFFKDKHLSILVLQNNGMLHLINPVNETLLENVMQLPANSALEVSPDCSSIVAVSENGKGVLIDNYSPLVSLGTNRHSIKRRMSDAQKVAIEEHDFSFNVSIVKKWMLHKIQPQQNQAVVLVKFCKSNVVGKIEQDNLVKPLPLFLTGTNCGEVKIWSINGRQLGVLNSAEYPSAEINTILQTREVPPLDSED